ncbi:hypothetical protein [Pontixanthobacter sp.]|uniref:hypothetical protein n=1 Tax=Pontixanthobacter sp. TaxID=2792078 RepID=UPI003C7A9E3C
MFEAFVLLATISSPDFTLTHPARGAFEADIFAINAEQTTDQTLELLIAEEKADLQNTVAEVPIGEDDELTVTTLRDTEGSPIAAYFYRLDMPETDRSWVCRIRFSREGGPGLARSARWCLSFIGGAEYRPTVQLRPN